MQPPPTERLGGGSPTVKPEAPTPSDQGGATKAAAGGAASTVSLPKREPGTAGNFGEAATGRSVEGIRTAKRRGPELDSRERKRKRLLPILLLIAGVAVIAIAMLTMRDTDTDTSARPTPRAGGQPSPSPTVARNPLAKVGEVVERGDFQATVLTVRRDYKPTNPLEVPEAGMKIVAVEFKLTNKSDHGVIIESTRQFKVRDSSNTLYDFSPTGAPDPRFPDGPIAAGQTVQGWIAFKVPQAASGLKLVFDARVERAP